MCNLIKMFVKTFLLFFVYLCVELTKRFYFVQLCVYLGTNKDLEIDLHIK